MLGDPRAESLVKNFGGQWLHLRNLAAFVPTRDDFPEFDDALRQAMRTETEMLLDSLRLENRSVLDLLTRRLHVRQRAAGPPLRDAWGLR